MACGHGTNNEGLSQNLSDLVPHACVTTSEHSRHGVTRWRLHYSASASDLPVSTLDTDGPVCVWGSGLKMVAWMYAESPTLILTL